MKALSWWYWLVTAIFLTLGISGWEEAFLWAIGVTVIQLIHFAALNGGHGALICALKEEGAYRSVSAFSPICHPSICGWGEGCFTAYLGEEKGDWKAYDTTELIKAGAAEIPLLIDQGTNDEFLAEQLYPKELQAACEERSFPLTLRMQEGYDHSYHFIASFIGEHLSYHAEALRI
ncbi:MAG: hypothetical protein KZQ86_15290 [Candidatus Thiodiazotropha sp. (ex Lucinoma kastoroae)]|nr:hypothetical protein [Candidatus Thiodiazotropha sp. (ex Lucinoma kastoroae)]